MSNELVPYADIEKMGKAVATSGLFGVKTEAQAVALMLIAQAYGKHPAVAAMEYNIINNRPSKKSEAMLASFQEAGGTVKWIELTDKKAKAEFHHLSGGTLELEWTIEMAQKAGLIDKEYSNYKKYPRAMLRSRVVAEGVRAVYPAATGGMLSKEEAEDIIEPDTTNSRVENIIDAQVTEVIDATKEEPKAKEDKPKESKKPAKDTAKAVSGIDSLPEGHTIIQGVITTPATFSTVPDRKDRTKEVNKWVFVMNGLKLGTFEESVFKGISNIIDLQKETPILLNIEYKEVETTPGKFVKDIVSFKQAVTVTGKDVPI